MNLKKIKKGRKNTATEIEPDTVTENGQQSREQIDQQNQEQIDQQNQEQAEQQNQEQAEQQERKTDRSNYVYIVECADHTYYTGWTTDVARRVACHNSGKGAKYTRSRLPVVLRYYEAYETKQEAMSREYAIKQLSRQEKEELIAAMKERLEP